MDKQSILENNQEYKKTMMLMAEFIKSNSLHCINENNMSTVDIIDYFIQKVRKNTIMIKIETYDIEKGLRNLINDV